MSTLPGKSRRRECSGDTARRSVHRPAGRLLALTLAGAVMAAATLLAAAVTPAAAAPNQYVRMSDGVLIAVNVRMPDHYVKGKKYPAIFLMDGYDGGSSTGRTLAGTPDSRAQLTWMFNTDYVTVHASIRGTGCSGGEFDLFSWRTALDGREIIEWIARQPWSNGKVGIMGHSYSGITGFMVAATQPPHLTAVTVSGLIDDLYRGLVYPGGVSNYGFPLLWTGLIRPAYEAAGGTAPGLVAADPTCARNVATHRRTITNDPILEGLISDTDNDWYRSRSLITYADKINVPIHITGAYQDEQTGPRGPAHLWEKVRGVPKRLVLTNGVHSTQVEPPEIWQDRLAWMDHWLRGIDGGFGKLHQDRTSVVTLLEMHETGQGLRSNGRKLSRTFPLEDTIWTSWYLRGNGKLSTRPPDRPEEAASYVSGPGRQSWSYQLGPGIGPPLTTAPGPDEVEYRSEPFREDTLVAGPITATLYMATTAPDTEIFVQLIDEAPDGSRSYLQRGMLRASHRAIDYAQSDYTAHGVLYRPHRPHTNPQPVRLGKVEEYLIEVFPVGHVFRAGHRLVIKVHAPPVVDGYYVYVPRRLPAIHTIYHGPEHPSRIMLPVVPLAGVKLGPELPCGAQVGVRCVSPGGR
ncbi:MAG TPA: CocE/NonD family hydrolase [Thermaerobacter sp.]